MTVEIKLYAAELRALLACASEEMRLAAVHFSTDLTRIFATNGHVLAMRHAVDADPREKCETFTIDRGVLETALAIADAADRRESRCPECQAPKPPDCDEWARRIVITVVDGTPRLAVNKCTIPLGDTKSKAPPVWTVMPEIDEIGRGRGRMIAGVYLEQIGTLSGAVEARCGRHAGWCIAFAGEAVLPDGKPNGQDFGPLVATCEAPPGHEFSWIYVVMPLRPTEPATIAWHERVNGRVPKTIGELASKAAPKKKARAK